MEIMLGAFQDEGVPAVPGQDVALGPDRRLHVDVAVENKRHGVAYVTGLERAGLGSSLPLRDASMSDALQVVSGRGEQRDHRILVLHDSDYAYDDGVGEAHQKSTLTAELKLRRDVRDFLVRARSENWP